MAQVTNPLTVNYHNDPAFYAKQIMDTAGFTAAKREKWKNKVTTIYPWDKDYGEQRQDTNRRFVYYPLAIVLPKDAQEVADTLKLVKKYKFPFSVRAGGHNSEAYSLSIGFVIDVSKINHCNLNKELHYEDEKGKKTAFKTVTVGAGNRIGPLSEALWKHHLALPAGTCPNVGVAGLTLGGGIGFMTKEHGLTLDNLLGVEIVLADGKIVWADDRHYSDLFWALRGGGSGNFGIVTQFKYKVWKINKVTLFTLTFPFAQFVEVADAWQHWAPETSKNLTSSLVCKNKGGELIVEGDFLGCKADFYKYLQPMLRLKPIKTNIRRVKYIDAVRNFAGTGHWPPFFKTKNGFVPGYIPRSALAQMHAFLHKGNGTGLVEMNSFGGRVNQIHKDATAFWYRDTRFWVLINNHWADQRKSAKEIKWANKMYDSVKVSFKGAYVNMVDAELPNYLEEYYGGNLPRLIQIKTKYDPHNLFNYPQSIPPSQVNHC